MRTLWLFCVICVLAYVTAKGRGGGRTSTNNNVQRSSRSSSTGHVSKKSSQGGSGQQKSPKSSIVNQKSTQSINAQKKNNHGSNAHQKSINKANQKINAGEISHQKRGHGSKVPQKSSSSNDVNRKSNLGRNGDQKSNRAVTAYRKGNSNVNRKSSDVKHKTNKNSLNIEGNMRATSSSRNTFNEPKRAGNRPAKVSKATKNKLYQTETRETSIKRRSKRSSRNGRSSLPTLKFDCSKMPHICGNIRDDLDSGRSPYLTRAGSSYSKRNRQIACGGVSSPRGMSCDEFPPASTREGGYGAKTAIVPIEENYSQGGQLAAFYRNNGITRGGRRSRFKISRPGVKYMNLT